MNTLFISTYSELLTIGILLNGKITLIKEKISERSHSANLIPLIESVLSEKNIDINEINELIVINGPGSFTGVRLGVTVAKTLAFTLKIPIKTVTSIEALAVSDSNQDRKLVTINDNKGKYFGLFENNKLLSEIKYHSEAEFHNFHKENKYPLINVIKLDMEAIYDYVLDSNSLNPHEVKAVYIKTIEVEQ